MENSIEAILSKFNQSHLLKSLSGILEDETKESYLAELNVNY